MSTNNPEIGRLDQVVSAVTWNSTTRPLPRAAAVTSGVPSDSCAQVLAGQARLGLGQHLPGHGDFLGHVQAGEGARRVEGRQRLGLFPRQRAAQHPAAPAQRHRHQIVGRNSTSACRRSGPAGPAVLDPLRDAVAGRPGEGADVGQHQHGGRARRAWRADGIGRAGLGLVHVGEGAQRLAQVVVGRKQRLVGVGRVAADDAHRTPPPARLSSRRHRAGRVPADDFEPRHLVAQLDGQVRTRRRFRSWGPKANGASPIVKPFGSSARTRPRS